MILQDFFQFFRCGMERKADVFYQSLLFLFLHEASHIEFVKKLRAAFTEIMQKIEIKIACARLL